MRKQNNGPVIRGEMKLMNRMVALYYKNKANDFTISEKRMQSYAINRLASCRFGEEKTTCRKCPVHCYQEKYRLQMKKIMRYSGPKMLIRHPVLCMQHAARGMIRRVES